MNLYDGELVQDFVKRPKQNGTGAHEVREYQQMPSFLVFDALVVNFNNVMTLNFRTRLKAAQDYITKNHTIFRVYLEKEFAKAQKAFPPRADHFVMLYMKDMFEVWQTP